MLHRPLAITILALSSVLAEFRRGIDEVAPLHLIGATDDKLADQEFYVDVARAAGQPVTWAPLLANPFDPSGALTLIEASAAALSKRGTQHNATSLRAVSSMQTQEEANASELTAIQSQVPQAGLTQI